MNVNDPFWADISCKDNVMWDDIHAFFIGNSFISNARLKLAKN